MWSKVQRRGGASSYRRDWNCAISRPANTRSLMLNSCELHFENFEMRVSVDAVSHPPNAFCLFDGGPVHGDFGDRFGNRPKPRREEPACSDTVRPRNQVNGLLIIRNGGVSTPRWSNRLPQGRSAR
jgi:hypothetical protein